MYKLLYYITYLKKNIPIDASTKSGYFILIQAVNIFMYLNYYLTNWL